MGTLRTTRLATFDPLAAETDIRFGSRSQRTGTFQAGPGEYEQATELVLIEILDGIDEIPVERHARRTYATSRGANSWVALR